LSEYREFAGMPFEIQIRSILQHAWAEIEHDLGYKSKVAVPKEIRRKFARVAGALEAADEDFNEIKNYLREYESNVAQSIAADPGSVTVDSISLTSYLKNSPTVCDLDLAIAKKIGVDVRADDKEHKPLTALLIRGLKHIKVHTIAELESELSRYSRDVIDFIETFIDYNTIFGMEKEDFKDIPRGWSIMFLPYVRIFKSTAPDVIKLHNLKEYFLEVIEPNGGSGKIERATQLSKKMFDSYLSSNKQ
jgi:putative GTP pyrophosphokinase